MKGKVYFSDLFYKRLLRRIFLAAILIYASFSLIQANEDISAISISDYEGYIEFRFREDEQLLDNNGLITSETRTSFEQEVFLLTHGSIYHENLLSLDLGFGFILNQSDLQNDATLLSDKDTEYNLTSRFSFLKQKPYPVVFFYNIKHPIAALSLTDRFQQEVEEFGFEIDVMQPVLPFLLEIEAFEQKTTGQGFDVRIDEHTIQKIIRAEIPIGTRGFGKIALNSTDLISSSGFLSAPISTTEYKTDNLSFNSRHFLGEDREYQLTNTLSYVRRTDVRPLDEFRFTPELRWQHSKDLSSVYRLNYLKSEQLDVNTTNTNFSAGLNYNASQSTRISLDFQADDNATTGLNQSKYGVSGNIRYKTEWFLGGLNFSGALKYENYNNQVTANVPVRDLQISFTGTETQFLPHDNILTTTIRVFRMFNGNLTELIVGVDTSCNSGIDILIVTINARTRIENCNGSLDGNISASIQYEYNPGGTVGYSNFVQGYQVNFDIFQYANIFLRWHDSRVDINSGTPTLAIEEMTRTNLGVRIDYPLYQSFVVGMAVNVDKEKGSLISFDRESVDGYLQLMLFGGKMRLSKHYDTINYQSTIEDVKLERLALQFQIRPLNKFSLTLNMSDEKSIGGISDRHSKTVSAKLLWRLRELIITGDVRMIDEQHDLFYRDRSQISVNIRRSF